MLIQIAGASVGLAAKSADNPKSLSQVELRKLELGRALAGRPKVLIADDEPNIVVSLEFLMKREGYQVLVARDGVQALATIQRERPALVLLDVMMPGKTGFEVCQAVRADDTLAGVKIVLLTAKGRDTDVAKGMALGADAYVIKPFSTKELAARVRELLQQGGA